MDINSIDNSLVSLNNLSNNKQIGLSVMMYTEDYEETYPAKIDGSANFGGHMQTVPNEIYPYCKNWKIFTCPSQPAHPYSMKESKGILDSPADGLYKYNWHYSFSAHVMPIVDGNGNILKGDKITTLGSIEKPATKVIMFEQGNVNSNVTTVDMMWGNLSDLTRHNGGANYTFADGHAKFFKYDGGIPWNANPDCQF